MKTIHTTTVIALALIAVACDNQPAWDAQGTFEATEVTISSETPGRIMYINVDEGDSVTAGADIALIDTLQLQLQRQELLKQHSATLSNVPNISAQVSSLREQISGARVERDRVKRLLADGAATQRQLDEANTRLAALEGQLSAQLSMLGNNTSSINSSAAAVDVKIAQIDDKIARSRISSPINGVVLAKYAEPGEVTAFGKPLLRVADLGNMYLQAYFTSDQLADIKLGQKVRVEADYGGDNTRAYDGVISFIASQSQFTPKTIQTKDSRANLVYEVKIRVKNDGLLKIGLSGNVYLK